MFRTPHSVVRSSSSRRQSNRWSDENSQVSANRGLPLTPWALQLQALSTIKRAVRSPYGAHRFPLRGGSVPLTGLFELPNCRSRAWGRGLPPYPLGAGSARPKPKKGAPDTENPSSIWFTVLGGGQRPWSQTMLSEWPDHGVAG